MTGSVEWYQQVAESQLALRDQVIGTIPRQGLTVNYMGLYIVFRAQNFEGCNAS